MASKVAEVVRTLVAPQCNELGLELVNVEYVKEGSRYMLRLFIDKPGGVTLADCELLSRRIDPILDAADPVPGSYYLEVSSPGLDRPLKLESDFARFSGSQVKIRTFTPVSGSKNLVGKLLGSSNGNVLLELNGQEVAIPLSQVAKANLVPEL